MTSNEILQADMLDILFDHRNKSYGAYQLRKTYHRRMLLATGLTALLVTGVLWLIFKWGSENVASITGAPGPVMLTMVDLTPPVAPPPPPAPARHKAVAHYTDLIEIVPDVQMKAQDFPPVEDLARSAFGAANIDGEALEGGLQPAATEAPMQAAMPEPPAEPVFFESNAVDQMAEFPGGTAAFQRYLARQLSQPEGLEPGERKVVKVQFVIEKDGAISRLAVVQSGGALLDDLVFKVLQKAPRWKPALHKGRAVAVIFTQPVTFIGAEE